MLLEVVVDENTQTVEALTQKKGPKKAPHHPRKLLELLLGNHLINDVRSEFGVDKSKGQGKHGTTDGARREPLVGLDVVSDPSNHLPGTSLGGSDLTHTLFARSADHENDETLLEALL